VWAVVTAEESHRTLSDRGRSAVTLHDVVVRAARRLAARPEGRHPVFVAKPM
jgi:hypothetical protein